MLRQWPDTADDGARSTSSGGASTPLRVEDGESLSFRYRFVFHEGDFEQAEIARRYEEYTRRP